MDTKVIVMANNKGGVGKTSSVAALGDVLARKFGRKVLLIDADPQGNLSRRFRGKDAATIDTTFEVYLQSEYEARKQGQKNELQPSLFFNEAEQKRPSSKIVRMYDNLRVIYATPELQSVYEAFQYDANRAGSIIRRFLFGLKSSGEFDYILIDASPALSYILGQFLVGCDYLMIPLFPSEDAIEGAERVLNAFNIAYDDKQDYEYKELRFLGFFFCNIRNHTIAEQEYAKRKDAFWDEENFFKSKIPQCAAVVNAGNNNKGAGGAPVTAVYPNSPASYGYVDLAREMEKRIKEFEEGARE